LARGIYFGMVTLEFECRSLQSFFLSEKLFCLGAPAALSFLYLSVLIFLGETQGLYLRAQLLLSLGSGVFFFFRPGADRFQRCQMLLLLLGVASCLCFNSRALFSSATTRIFKSLPFFFGTLARFLFGLQPRFLFRTQALLLGKQLSFFFCSLSRCVYLSAMPFNFQCREPDCFFFPLQPFRFSLALSLGCCEPLLMFFLCPAQGSDFSLNLSRFVRARARLLFGLLPNSLERREVTFLFSRTQERFCFQSLSLFFSATMRGLQLEPVCFSASTRILFGL